MGSSLHAVTCAWRLDKQQAQLKKYSMLASDEERTQQYVEQMYCCNMFDKTEISKWECKDDVNNTWALAKTYFEILFTEKQTFEDNTGAGNSSFESANNVGESRSQGLPFDGRSLGSSTFGSIPNLGSG